MHRTQSATVSARVVAARLAGCHTGCVRPMSTLICFALKEEAAPFRKIAGGLRYSHSVSILLTGIGRQNAEKSVLEFLNSCRSRGNETQIKNILETPHVVSYDPNLVLTCGFAGGLNPDLKPGEVAFELSTLNSQLAFSLPAPNRPSLSAPTASPRPLPKRKNCARKPARMRWKWNRR